MTSIQWQRVAQGKWKDVGTKVSEHVPIPGLASLDLPYDVLILIKSYLAPSKPTNHNIGDCIDCVASEILEDSEEDLDWDEMPPVYKLLWVNVFKRHEERPDLRYNYDNMTWYVSWITPWHPNWGYRY